jgi:DNA-binding winged helix-turn-helix (wHTH) protein/TolB-like protein
MRQGGGKDEEEMSGSVHGSGRLSIGVLSFDPESGDLAGPAGIERIAPQPASLLALLAARMGEVVSRNEIRDHLWPGGKVEFEQGIAFAVREVRKAIETAGGDPTVLETIPRRGLRLVSSSPRLPMTGPWTGSAESPSTASPESQAVPPRRVDSPRVLLLPIAAVVLVATVGLGVALRREPPFDMPSVVVFVHDTEGVAHEELAQAVGFELTTALTRAFAGRLGVVGPTGTSTLAGPDDTRGARGSLGACLVVSGDIRAVGVDSVVVFTQVVRTRDRVHTWADLDTVPTRMAAGVVARVVEGVEQSAASC